MTEAEKYIGALKILGYSNIVIEKMSPEQIRGKGYNRFISSISDEDCIGVYKYTLSLKDDIYKYVIIYIKDDKIFGYKYERTREPDISFWDVNGFVKSYSLKEFDDEYFTTIRDLKIDQLL